MSKAQVSIINDEESLIVDGHVGITKCMFSFSHSMVLKCAVELRIADIIHSNGQPLTLSQIASSIDSPTVDISYLFRIMRMLVRMKIFTLHKSKGEDNNSILRYGLSPSSNVILHDNETSLAPFILLENHPIMMSTWHHLSDCVREGWSGFKKTHGVEVFEMASFNPELNKMFNAGMRCMAKMHANAIFSTVAARDVFSGIVGTLVDVGGGVGQMIAEIVNDFNDIKGVNFDLAHVIEMAPNYDGVTDVAGDMFKEIPTADAIFMKAILHDWGDEDCVKILKNCRNAMKKESGKVIIVDIVIKEDEEDEGLYGNIDIALDILMMAHSIGGKERTKLEWKEILEEAGFPRYNIIELPSLPSLIEAFIS